MKIFSIIVLLLASINLFSQDAEIAKFCKDNKKFTNVCNTFKYTSLSDAENNPNLLVYSLINDISVDLMSKQGEISKIKDLVTHNSLLVVINRFLNNSYDLDFYYVLQTGIVNDINNHLYKRILSNLEKAKATLGKINDDSLKQTKENIELLIRHFTEFSKTIAKAGDDRVKIEDIKAIKDKQEEASLKMREIKQKIEELKTISELSSIKKNIETIIEMTEISVLPFKPIIKGYYSYFKGQCLEDTSNMKALDICQNFKDAKTDKSINKQIFILNTALEVIELYKNDNINYYNELVIFKNIIIALLKRDINLLTVSFAEYFSFAKTDVKVSTTLIKTLQNSNLFNTISKKDKKK